MVYYFIALAIIALDQYTKRLVVAKMELGQSIPLWPDVFHLTSHRNAGAAFGILQDQRWFFIIVTVAVVCGIVYYLHQIRKQKPLLALGLAFILGGAIGNFIDRVRTGEVVDFFDFTLINFPIFNVADSFICIGVGVFILDMLLDIRREKKEQVANE